MGPIKSEMIVKPRLTELGKLPVEIGKGGLKLCPVAAVAGHLERRKRSRPYQHQPFFPDALL